jgi:hypothetical protein
MLFLAKKVYTLSTGPCKTPVICYTIDMLQMIHGHEGEEDVK